MLYSKYVNNEYVEDIEGDFDIGSRIGDYIVNAITLHRNGEAKVYLEPFDEYLRESTIVHVEPPFITISELGEILRPLGFEIKFSKKT